VIPPVTSLLDVTTPATSTSPPTTSLEFGFVVPIPTFNLSLPTNQYSLNPRELIPIARVLLLSTTGKSKYAEPCPLPIRTLYEEF